MNPLAREFNSSQGQSEQSKPQQASNYLELPRNDLNKVTGDMSHDPDAERERYMTSSQLKYTRAELTRLEARVADGAIDVDARTSKIEDDVVRLKNLVTHQLELVYDKINELERKLAANAVDTTLPGTPTRVIRPSPTPATQGTTFEEVDFSNLVVVTPEDFNSPEQTDEVASGYLPENAMALALPEEQQQTPSALTMVERTAIARAKAIAENQAAHEAAIAKAVQPVRPPRWMPDAVYNMCPVYAMNYSNETTFTVEFVKRTFGGAEVSPSFYYDKGHSAQKPRAYWLLEAGVEPCAPLYAGTHGAKLTVFFNGKDKDGEDIPANMWVKTPVFVRLGEADEYTYVGDYTQNRRLDIVDYDTVTERIPEKVFRFWTAALVHPDRPEWVTTDLMEAFLPKPRNNSTLADSSGSMTAQPAAARAAYLDRLKAWEKEAKAKVAKLTEEDIMEAFFRVDRDPKPHLRMHWEYLEFNGFNRVLYKELVGCKEREAIGLARKKEEAIAEAAKSRHGSAREREANVEKVKAEMQVDNKAFVPPHLRHRMAELAPKW